MGEVGDLAARLDDRLALLGGEQRREVLRALLDQRRGGREDVRALLGVGRRPLRERALAPSRRRGRRRPRRALGTLPTTSSVAGLTTSISSSEAACAPLPADQHGCFHGVSPVLVSAPARRPSCSLEVRLPPLAGGREPLAVVVGLQQRGLREALGEDPAALVDVGGERAAGASRRRTRAARGRASAPRARGRPRQRPRRSAPARSAGPAARAASASRSSPPSSTSFARARPSSLTRRVSPPWVGTRPTRPSRNSTRAVGEPTRQSQASASARPAPVTTPSIAATTGFSRRSTDSTRSVRRCDDVPVGARVVELVEAAEVAAGAERAARAGEHDAAHGRRRSPPRRAPRRARRAAPGRSRCAAPAGSASGSGRPSARSVDAALRRRCLTAWAIDYTLSSVSQVSHVDATPTEGTPIDDAHRDAGRGAGPADGGRGPRAPRRRQARRGPAAHVPGVPEGHPPHPHGLRRHGARQRAGLPARRAARAGAQQLRLGDLDHARTSSPTRTSATGCSATSAST